MDLPLPNGRLLTELNDADFNRFKSTCRCAIEIINNVQVTNEPTPEIIPYVKRLPGT
jgi:hypothetical protein